MYGDNEVGPDGLTKRERKFQEDSAACDEMIEEIIRKQVESIGFEETYDTVPPSEPPTGGATKHRMETRRMRAAAGKTKCSSSIPTVRARDAAAALSGTQRSVTRTRSAVLAKPRVTSALFPSKKPRSPTNPSSMRHSAATATSKSTVGYSRGRDVSSKMYGKTASPVKPEMEPKGILSPATYLQPYGTPPLIADTIGLGPESAEEALPTFGEDEDAENFQLTL